MNNLKYNHCILIKFLLKIIFNFIFIYFMKFVCLDLEIYYKSANIIEDWTTCKFHAFTISYFSVRLYFHFYVKTSSKWIIIYLIRIFIVTDYYYLLWPIISLHKFQWVMLFSHNYRSQDTSLCMTPWARIPHCAWLHGSQGVMPHEEYWP